MLGEILEPADLRRLDRAALPSVADELRSELIDIGAAIGGHFAASLGVVELSIGLHWVFETPHDRIVWDVGHQGYAHKALTGRLSELRRIKRADGPSGFLRRCESPFDVFGAGHAGTSISAALGMAEAARRRAPSRRVVAVIGDGGATAGMAFEALNHAGALRAPLRLIFNDNGMSIAPSVGGLASTGDVRGYAQALGIAYRGPVDGHDLAALLPALQALRDEPDEEGPVLLHVRTVKGKGFAAAEADPFGWHATTPFDRETGARAKSGGGGPPSWTEAFADALGRIADRDPRVVALTAAMPDGTGLDRFAERHPDRVYDVGIAEQHAVTFAAGLAAEGLRPVCAIYSTFLQRAFDQIVHDVALQSLPVVFALDRAGLVGGDGPTHHGALDLAYLRSIPNLVVAAPRDENELQRLLATAIEGDRPFAIRFPRGKAIGVAMDPDPKPLRIGRGELLQPGDDVALLALGKGVPEAQRAAELLEAAGLSVAVADARFVKPLDTALLESLADRARVLVTLEDHARSGGLGSAVAEWISETHPELRLLRVGIGDHFVDHGDAAEQWEKEKMNAEAIVRAVCDELA